MIILLVDWKLFIGKEGGALNIVNCIMRDLEGEVEKRRRDAAHVASLAVQ